MIAFILILVAGVGAVGISSEYNREEPKPDQVKICQVYQKVTECKSHWVRVK